MSETRRSTMQPEPVFGRFTDVPAEAQEREWWEWICEAEEALVASRRAVFARQSRDLFDRAVECIEHARRTL